MVLTLLLFFLFFLIFVVNRIVKYFLLSPIYLYISFSIVSIILTFLYHYLYEDKISLFNLDKVSNKDFIHAMKMYILALISFVLGVIVFYDFSKKNTKLRFNKSYTDNLFVDYDSSNVLKYIVISVFIIVLTIYLIVYKEGLFVRENYLPDTLKGLTTISKILTFIEVMLLGLIYKKEKILSRILFVLLILISLSTGSRSVFVFVLFFSCLLFFTGGNNLYNKLRFCSHIVLSFVFLAFIMGLRRLDSHGLFPYLKSLGNTSLIDLYDKIVFNIYYSFIYGVYVTIGTLKEANLDWNIVLININPLPGKFVGWYDYASKMRLNFFVPYSLHGRVFKTGLFFSFFYFFITGVIFSFFENIIRNLLTQNKRILSFLIIIMLLLHIVYAFEYNMRASIRFIYYALFFILMSYFIRQIHMNLPKKK